MNANVLHRWLKEHERSGRHALTEQQVVKNPERPAFVALALPTPKVPTQSQDIRVVLSKGALTINVSWPMHAVAELASWTTAILKWSASTPSGWPAPPWTCAQAPILHWHES